MMYSSGAKWHWSMKNKKLFFFSKIFTRFAVLHLSSYDVHSLWVSFFLSDLKKSKYQSYWQIFFIWWKKKLKPRILRWILLSLFFKNCPKLCGLAKLFLRWLKSLIPKRDRLDILGFQKKKIITIATNLKLGQSLNAQKLGISLWG